MSSIDPVRFLAELGPLVTAYSKAFLLAVKGVIEELANAVVRGCRWVVEQLARAARWAWSTYYRFEHAIADVLASLILGAYAFRFALVVLGLGVVLGYFGQWLILTVYVALLVLAYMRFKVDRHEITREQQVHERWRDVLTNVVGWGLRIGVAAFAFLFVHGIPDVPARLRPFSSTSVVSGREPSFRQPAIDSTPRNPVQTPTHGVFGDRRDPAVPASTAQMSIDADVPRRVSTGLRDAERLFEQREYDAALRALDAVLALDGANAEAREIKTRIVETLEILDTRTP